MRLIDLHTHLLPKMDDGASDIEESLAMIREAYRQGIRAAYVTPHYSRHFPANSRQEILEARRRFAEELDRRLGFAFTIYPGQEILYSQDTLRQLEAGELLALGRSNRLLVEFLPTESFANICHGISELTMEGVSVILAHVERYVALRDPGRLEELRTWGVEFQMNLRPIGLSPWKETTRWCRRMLKQERIHYLGTDMHNIHSRRPAVSPGFEWMKKHLSGEYLKRICWENAYRLQNTQEE